VRVVHHRAMTTIIGISGSLRAASYNTKLLRLAAKLAPAGTTIEVATIEGIPLYNEDVEKQGIPEAVTALRERIVAADGLLIATPEYNNSMPGVLKNAIDWLTRPPSEVPRTFNGRPVALMGATLGQGGTLLSQAAWLPVLRTLGTLPWFGGRLQVSGAASAFDANGGLTDEKQRAQLEKFVAGFAKFVDMEAAAAAAGVTARR
jgi:NAD(P)H-dependent FMN reductase